MELISVGNVILNLDRISALDIDQKVDGTCTLHVFTDSSDPIITVNLAPEVPDQLLNLVPHKVRLVGLEAVPH